MILYGIRGFDHKVVLVNCIEDAVAFFISTIDGVTNLPEYIIVEEYKLDGNLRLTGQAFKYLRESLVEQMEVHDFMYGLFLNTYDYYEWADIQFISKDKQVLINKHEMLKSPYPLLEGDQAKKATGEEKTHFTIGMIEELL
jgi:hypothetical protein